VTRRACPATSPVKRRTRVIAVIVFLFGLASLLMPSLNWDGAAAVPIEVEVRDAGSGALLSGVTLTLLIDGVAPPPTALTPNATTGIGGHGKLMGMFGAGGTRSFIWSSGSIGTDVGVVRCNLAGYQPLELKLSGIKTRKLFGLGPAPRLRVKASMKSGA